MIITSFTMYKFFACLSIFHLCWLGYVIFSKPLCIVCTSIVDLCSIAYVIYFKSFCHEVNILIPLLTETKNLVLCVFLKVRFNFDYLRDQTYHKYI